MFYLTISGVRRTCHNFVEQMNINLALLAKQHLIKLNCLYLMFSIVILSYQSNDNMQAVIMCNNRERIGGNTVSYK